MEFVLITAFVLGVSAMFQKETFDPTDNDDWNVPVELPRIEGRDFDPPSTIPWGDINRGNPLPEATRSMTPLYRNPQIWVEKTEVKSEGFAPKVDRNPLYPDDLRAYDTLRSRMQKIHTDSANRNYAFGNYHSPYTVRNATRQEVSQSSNLAGRVYTPFTTGGQDKNPVFHIGQKDPSATSVRRRQDHVVDDRATTQVWTKKLAEEMTSLIMQPPLATTASIKQPSERIQPTKTRDFGKYLNVRDFQHGWGKSDGRTQTASLAITPDTLKTKKLLLVGDQGFPSSQVTHFAGYLEAGALTYPKTGRRREILPEVSHGGLYNGGMGNTFFDQNKGNTLKKFKNLQVGADSSRTRLIQVPSSTIQDIYLGEGSAYGSSWDPHNPTNDHVIQPKGSHAAWKDYAKPTWQSDNAHALEVPLLR